MFCSKCGLKVVEDSKFCGGCGTLNAEIKYSDASISIQRSKNINFGSVMKNSNNRTYKIKIGSIIFIGFLLIAGFFLLSDNLPSRGVHSGMHVGRYYMHDGENFIDGSLLNFTVFEFRGRGQGAQHLPGISVPFEYSIQNDRLIINMQGVELEYVIDESRDFFVDTSGLAMFALRR